MSIVSQAPKHAAILAWIGVLACAPLASAANSTEPIDFARDVRPILADNCLHCHGPDGEVREADLRLDVWQDAGDVRGAEAVITRGDAAESELVARIVSDDPALRMPPADSGKTLSPEQVEILKTWVAQGAQYQQHWAFVAPERPAVPEVKDPSWVRNPIDAFVLARLEREGLSPSAPARPNALLRRLSLDLVGLPPTLEEIAAFDAASDSDRPLAYSQEVQRLLGSPHHGELWGRMWLDAARYADSDGFEKDKPRSVWMYRDWVVNAINQDMPYDDFIVEQIAGDLLPSPTQDQLIATGFLRNSMYNDEGGADPEQFRMEAMYDRVDAVGKAILGLTTQCAQCHTHKYDPLTQAEYYRMFAFLNNCHEAQITVYTPKQQREWQATLAVVRRIEDGLRADNSDWRDRLEAWEVSIRNDQPQWTILHPEDDHSGDEKHYILNDHSVLATGYAPTRHYPRFSADAKLPKITAVRLELLTDSDLPRGGPGRSIQGTGALTEFQLAVAPLDNSAPPEQLRLIRASADVNPPVREVESIFDLKKEGERRLTGPIHFAIDGDAKTAWSIDVGPGRSNVPRKAVFIPERLLESPSGMRLTITLLQDHGGANNNDNQNNGLGRYRFAVTAAENPVADPVPADVRAVLQVPAAERTAEQSAHVFSYWRTTVPDWHEENRRIEALWQSHPLAPSQLVLMERKHRRDTHRLDRGNYLAPAEAVTPDVPAFLHSLVRGPVSPRPEKASLGETRPQAPPTRLDFAHWLADRRSPTTARTIVNRIWQGYFGIGLCETSEDLGTQGTPPSHPELLDWLAVELMDNDWSLKHIHRLIVSSSTYQQSSAVTPELLARDPKNRLLARGPRYRVDAEIVRDIALAASGLLNPKLGGPSVYPPAPGFLFLPPASYGEKTWNVETGSERYRRALYTFRFRSAPYPPLQNFDAPIGEVSCARRPQSNTPLQALTMLNEPLFLECAQAFAVSILTNGGASDADRIAYATRRCLTREPQPDELRSLQGFLDRQKERFGREGADPAALLADESLTHIKRPDNVQPADLAAWTALARVVLNLDETITKE